MKNKFAFTLIELSVVLLIIGLITAGIVKGISLIRSARLSSARSLSVESRISSVPGMVAWYETSMIDSFLGTQVTDTSQVSEWRDISPGSLSAQKNKLTRTASSAVIYKSDGINNLPSLQFGSSGNFSLSAFYQGSLGQSTIFIVMCPTAAPAASPTMSLLDSHSSSSTSSTFGIIDTKIMFNLGTSVGTAAVSNIPSFTINNNYILAVYYDNANSRAFANNAESMAGGSLVSPSNNPLNGLTIGTTKASATAFTGLISEIIIYDRPLPIDERKSVMSYLSKKYNIRVTGI